MLRYGTAYFTTLFAASKYYGSAMVAQEKIREGEIFIGQPPIKTGQKLSIIPGEGRYQIEEEEYDA